MSKSRLDEEERELLNEFNSDGFESTLTPKRKEALKAIAEETVKKNKRINIRISGRDLEALQRRALEEGIPYQTLVSSILHKYVSGGLQDLLASKGKRSDNR